jgi:hypothetical protein
MAAQKLQVGRALAVLPSDNTDIPFPMEVAIGTASGGSATTLVDATATFITSGVKPGDIIYNIGTGAATTVLGVNSETTIMTIGGAAFAATNTYVIYQGSNNDGCVLYIGVGGDLDIITVGGDQVTLVNVLSGQFIPIQVKRVLTSSTVSSVLALW